MLSDYLRAAARTHPDRPAVRLRGSSISYAEMELASGALAGTLVRAGVCPGDRVAIWLNKSIEAVVAIHGVLEAGAAYVPIDPVAPLLRVEHIVKDCRVRCLVTSRRRLQLLDEALAALRPVAVVLVDGAAGMSEPAGVAVLDWSEALGAVPPPAPTPNPDRLAYILYTSGSTGSPKGVMLSHRNGQVFVDWVRWHFRLEPGDRLSSHAPFHFDLSILDLFGAASAAATLVLVPETQRGLGLALVQLVAEEGISVWYSVPAALARMIEAPNSSLLAESRLRAILFAGEVFPLKHLRALRAAVPGAELYNLYGPTETNVCTFHQVTDEDLAPTRTEPVPIGRACDYATTFMVADSGALLEPAAGSVGELCVGGDSVMLGYWGDPAGTAARMTPCVELAGRRAFRTGDIVRRDERGSYAFVGRRDDMVKSRGYRIELGEIETVLLRLDEVREAAVVAIPDQEIGARLEGYLVVTPGVHLAEGVVRRHCLEMLPRPMLPDRFHLVSALPRTSTGKLDRLALTSRSAEGR